MWSSSALQTATTAGRLAPSYRLQLKKPLRNKLKIERKPELGPSTRYSFELDDQALRALYWEGLVNQALLVCLYRKKMRANLTLLLVGAMLAATASSQTLRVPIDATRAPGDAFSKADSAVLQAQHNLELLTARTRVLKARTSAAFKTQPFIAPMVVRFTQSGKDLAAPALQTPGTPVTLVFDTTGTGVFPADYKTLLQNVFNAAQPTINLVFGPPSAGGPIHVVNFDATIGDRQAVTGGYFVPGSGATQPEIRFPVYSNPEATAVNFIHTLLLAYLGNNSYSFDAFQEGLVRAATMRIVRTPGALAAGLDAGQAELVLQSSYDIGPLYDWDNQPGLEGPTFIAPNLLTVPLPSGGSVGGPYLLKYRMGGSAWQKVLAQYPTFIAGLNAKLFATPSIGNNPTALLQAGQQVVDTITGNPNSTVEGYSLSEWAKRQYILHINTVRGQKVLVEPTPITSGLSGTDFGVFLIETHYFSTSGANQETLLSGTSFPIFWEGDKIPDRIFPSAQEDRMDIAGAYGAVTPNFPDLNAGAAYRVATDIPVGDQLERVYLPAGAIATATNQTPTTFFGTVIGATGTLLVKATVGNTLVANATVQNGAFGALVADNSFLGNASVVIQVIQMNNNVPTTLMTRRVNKGPGSLAVDLRVGGEATFNPQGGTVAKGLSGIGFPLQPYIDYEPNTLGTLTPNTLVARFNPSRATYDFFPEIEAFHIGHAYFVNMSSATPVSVVGRTHPGMAMSVALKPGWNLVTVPKMVTVTTLNVQVVHAADSPTTWSEAAGTDVGTDYFQFVPGPNDAATGAPETGSFVAVSDGTFHPGVAYFVRALDPEGVTLNFEPSSANSANVVGPFALPATTGWRMKCQVVTPTGASSMAIIGESPTATDAFDKKLDSGIPPSMGALQVVIQSTEPMYRDVRKQSLLQESYKLHVEGLSPGVKYSLRLSMLEGAIPYCTISDPAASYRKPAWAPANYMFTANGTTRDITIILPGGIK
jgi:hypothetical protein